MVPFLDTYRTICLAPEPAFRQILGTSGVALRRLGSSGSCGAWYARGEAPLGLREIDDGTIGIEDVPSTLFNVGIYQ